MAQANLILTLPQGSLVATSRGIDELGRHRSSSSAGPFHGRSIFVEVACEGGGRTAAGDMRMAVKAVLGGKRTKTALSKQALSVVPIDAITSCRLVETSGLGLALEGSKTLHSSWSRAEG